MNDEIDKALDEEHAAWKIWKEALERRRKLMEKKLAEERQSKANQATP